ncbi:DUF1743 domain-containing protein [Candidatus Altiarchaeota archaeon]
MMIVGIDDTDSLNGMCTTYLAHLVCEKFKASAPPRLVRLNPNIPYRTRGNGAVAISLDEPVDVIDEVVDLVRQRSHMQEPNTNPGVAFILDEHEQDLTSLHDLYLSSVSREVTLSEAVKAGDDAGAMSYKFNNGRGLIGALSAIGWTLSGDHTYELIAYRKQENLGTKRRLDEASVFRMNEGLYPQVFDSVDPETHQVLITPAGPDPVFCGIRGISEVAVRQAWDTIMPLEDIDSVRVFITNQATDDHIRTKRILDIAAYDCVKVSGTVAGDPRTGNGGHVFIELADESASMDLAAYEPTGGLRDIVRSLIPGDALDAYGSTSKYERTLNLEKIHVTSLHEKIVTIPPKCCGKNMTSQGTGKGFKCKKCGSRRTEDAQTRKTLDRGIEAIAYEVPPRSRRHLSKPLSRY